MFLVRNVDDLWNHIAYVMAYAPDQFPHEDFLAEDQQMNLERAFDQLRQGVVVAYPEPSFSSKRSDLNTILDRAYDAYRAGNTIVAGHTLNEFQDGIFKSE